MKMRDEALKRVPANIHQIIKDLNRRVEEN